MSTYLPSIEKLEQVQRERAIGLLPEIHVDLRCSECGVLVPELGLCEHCKHRVSEAKRRNLSQLIPLPNMFWESAIHIPKRDTGRDACFDEAYASLKHYQTIVAQEEAKGIVDRTNIINLLLSAWALRGQRLKWKLQQKDPVLASRLGGMREIITIIVWNDSTENYAKEKRSCETSNAQTHQFSQAIRFTTTTYDHTKP